MIVITVTNCPAKVKGDLSKWLFQVSTGVYAGKLGARVRDELWQRVCSEIKTGCATMVYTAQTEQGFDFRVHNTSWIPKDFDGFKIMMHPIPKMNETRKTDSGTEFVSRSREIEKIKSIEKSRLRKDAQSDYVVIDLETTGLDTTQDQIIELGYLVYADSKVIQKNSWLINPHQEVSQNILDLTGIERKELKESTVQLKDCLLELKEILTGRTAIIHNAAFDLQLLKRVAKENNVILPIHRVKDTLLMARKYLPPTQSKKLEDLSDYFGLEERRHHRALNDCYTTLGIFLKLKEMGSK